MHISASIPKWMAKELGFVKGTGQSDRIQELLMKGVLYERQRQEQYLNKRESSQPPHFSPVVWHDFSDLVISPFLSSQYL